jgi:UDP-N-acetylglucosamine 3-dehydrogenase
LDKLRIGIIGLGWFGEIHAETIAGVPNLELAALCTRTEDRLQALGDKFGVNKLYRDYNDMLADPEIDAVSICTMWDQHTEPAIAALKAGKHVFLEKPIASTVEDANKIIAASKGARGILFIGHIVRFNPRYRMAKQAIAEGRIGKVVALSSRRNIPAAWTPTILNKIGPIVGDAIHDTDIMLWLTGDKIVSDTFPNLGIVDANKLHSPDITYWPMFDGVRGGALREEFNYFTSCALSGTTPKIGVPEDAAAALEATLAAEESARTGNVVRIG